MKIKSLLVSLILIVMLSACGPVGPMPGGKLHGQIQSAPSSWQELESLDFVEIESGTHMPESHTIWAVTVHNEVYVVAGLGLKTAWVKNILENPRVLLKMEGNLYGLNAVKIDDLNVQAEVSKRYDEKYDLSQIETPTDDIWMFRLERS